MSRQVLVFLSLSLAACAANDADVDPATGDLVSIEQASLAFTREHVTADIYHYELVLPVGSAPNAALRIHRVVRERAPFVPRATPHAVMALHGDFSTFEINFAPTLGSPPSPAPGLAPYLAARNIDVWGVDRRWTLPGAADDISDFATMGVAQEIDDVRVALALARGVRLAGGSGAGRIALVGFSHGAQLAYAYTAVEAARPPAQRHVDALVPLDWYGAYGPEQAEDQAATCDFAAGTYQAVADGVIDSPNDFFIIAGQLAAAAPDDPSPFDPGFTNRGLLLFVVGQTYLVAPFAPFYHLLSPVLDGDVAVGLAETPEAAANAWLAGATPHQALLESADFDQLLCGAAPQPVAAPLSAIHVPVFYIGAAGGIGDLGVYATTQVASTDVETLVVRRFEPEQRAADFGHTDLLLADDAPALVWQPLADWLADH